MKIGINASFLRKPATGIGQVTVHFLNALIGQESVEVSGDEYILFVEELPPHEFTSSLPPSFRIVHRLPFYSRDDLVRKIWWERFLLPKLAKREECESFFSLYQCPTILKGIRHTMLVHDLIPRILPEYLNNMRKKLYWHATEKAITKCDHILSVSQSTARDLVKHLHLPPEKITVAHISTDPHFDRQLSEDSAEKIRIQRYALDQPYIYVGGGLDLRKNVESTMIAYKDLLDHHANPSDSVPVLVISGKLMPELSPLISDVERIARDLMIEDHVRILDFVPSEDLPALYSGATFFVFASRYEGFGLPVLEAMKCGVPVITANNSSLPEVGGEAVVYSDGSVKQIYEEMFRLLNDPIVCSTYAHRARERSTIFSWAGFLATALATVKGTR